MDRLKLIHGKWLVIAFLACISISCSKDGEEDIDNSDPLIGVWHLRVINTERTGPVEVTNRPCYQDSRFEANATSATLTLSFPPETGDCEVESLSFGWENEGGTYYAITDEGRQPLNVTLNDNNETLQLNLTIGGEPASLIFRK